MLAKKRLLRFANDSKQVSNIPSTLNSTFDRAETKMMTLCKGVHAGSIVPQTTYQGQMTHFLSINFVLVFLDFLISHLYVANPQARIGAIQTLLLVDWERMKDGTISCSQFKTEATFGYQFVSICLATQRFAHHLI